MPREERLTPDEAHNLLLKAGFEWIRSRGSHRIYRRESRHIIVPFHSRPVLHPKIINQIRQAISEACNE